MAMPRLFFDLYNYTHTCANSTLMAQVPKYCIFKVIFKSLTIQFILYKIVFVNILLTLMCYHYT